jgi:hypothetical protein
VKVGDGVIYASEVVVVENTTRANNARLRDPKLFRCFAFMWPVTTMDESPALSERVTGPWPAWKWRVTELVRVTHERLQAGGRHVATNDAVLCL